LNILVENLRTKELNGLSLAGVGGIKPHLKIYKLVFLTTILFECYGGTNFKQHISTDQLMMILILPMEHKLNHSIAIRDPFSSDVAG
jgi:hypothetical protein